MLRTGFGYDAHRLVADRPLIIGGTNIPYDFGLSGHSDADVLVHAIMDGILGAMAMGDIGMHFPDTDPAYKDADSISMLKRVMVLVKEEGYIVNNLDSTIVAQRPKLAPYIPEMKEKLMQALEVRADQLNIKATTTEGMGFCGQRTGMEAYAVVTLIKSET